MREAMRDPLAILSSILLSSVGLIGEFSPQDELAVFSPVWRFDQVFAKILHRLTHRHAASTKQIVGFVIVDAVFRHRPDNGFDQITPTSAAAALILQQRL